jgi:hypothetical protein
MQRQKISTPGKKAPKEKDGAFLPSVPALWRWIGR